MAEKKEISVNVRTREKILGYPTLAEPAATIAVEYVEAETGPDVAYIPVRDVGPESPDDYWKEIVAKAGPLYDKYRIHEAKVLRAKIEARLATKGETVTV